MYSEIRWIIVIRFYSMCQKNYYVSIDCLSYPVDLYLKCNELLFDAHMFMYTGYCVRDGQNAPTVRLPQPSAVHHLKWKLHHIKAKLLSHFLRGYRCTGSGGR